MKNKGKSDLLKGILKNKKVNFGRLLKGGFRVADNTYIYSTDILNHQFRYDIVVDKSGHVSADLFDIETNDKYVLHLMDGAEGPFVGQIQNEIAAVWQKIILTCFETDVFKSRQAKQLIPFIQKTYGDELEFLWPKFPNNAIWRRKDNRKWYAVLLTVAKNKIGLEGDEKIEILDLRVDPNDAEKTIDYQRYFPGYHMNKKSWITICLDGSLSLDEIKKRIEASYLSAAKK